MWLRDVLLQGGKADFSSNGLKFETSGSFTITASVQGTVVTCDTTIKRVRGAFAVAPTVVPVDKQAGATGNVAVAFSVFNRVPSNGKIVITFPSSFVAITSPTVSNYKVGGVSAASPTASASGLTLTVTVGSTISAGSSVSFSVGSVKNRESEGATGIFDLFKTTLSDDTVLDEASSSFNNADRPASTAIVPHRFDSSPLIQMRNNVSLAVGNSKFTLVPSNGIPVGGTLVLVFPSSFTINDPFSLTEYSVSGSALAADKTPTTSVSGSTVILTMKVQVAAKDEVSFKIKTTNPSAAGAAGAFVRIGTTNDGSTRVDECNTAQLADTDLEIEGGE